MTHIAADWEVHAFSGARFNHVADILEKMAKKSSPPSELEAIVVAVGINHREDVQIKLDKDLERIKTAGARMDDVKVYFVPPSYADKNGPPTEGGDRQDPHGDEEGRHLRRSTRPDGRPPSTDRQIRHPLRQRDLKQDLPQCGE